MGPKFKFKHYVPVLKGKRAEFPALSHLKSNKDVTPLIEAIPSAQPDEVPKKMAVANWPTTLPYFIDLIWLDDSDDEETPATVAHPVRQCFAEVAAKKQYAVPVTGLARSPGYQSAVQQVVTEQKHGLAVRLIADDFEEEGDNIEAALTAILGYFNAKPSEVDLLVDAGSVASMSAAAVAQMHRAHLELLPNLSQWRTLTVLAGAFPLSLGDLIRDQWNPVVRNDWRGWLSLATGPRKPARIPSFGDYAIAHPNLPPEGRATILAQLRYATDQSWIIWKGHDVFKHPSGFGQFIAICSNLIQRPEYRGPAFSFGDSEIHGKATNGGSPGNAETWRKIGTNHHLETVLEQIANLP